MLWVPTRLFIALKSILDEESGGKKKQKKMAHPDFGYFILNVCVLIIAAFLRFQCCRFVVLICPISTVQILDIASYY